MLPLPIPTLRPSAPLSINIFACSTVTTKNWNLRSYLFRILNLLLVTDHFQRWLADFLHTFVKSDEEVPVDKCWLRLMNPSKIKIHTWWEFKIEKRELQWQEHQRLSPPRLGYLRALIVYLSQRQPLIDCIGHKKPVEIPVPF